MNSQITSTTALAHATTILIEAGYAPIPESELGIQASRMRGFEDLFGIVLFTVWESWTSLNSDWPSAQSQLVEMISRHVLKADKKAWEGYLVLLCLGKIGGGSKYELDRIRFDTHRVRKLIATGDELESLSSIDRILYPLLPLEISEVAIKEENTLDILPDMLSTKEISKDAVVRLVQAFQSNAPLVAALHGQVDKSDKR